MIKHLHGKLKIIAAGLLFFCSLFSLPDLHAADMDFNTAYNDTQVSAEKTVSFIKPVTIPDIPSRGYYRDSLTPRFSWVNFFAAKMLEKKESFPWNTPSIIEEDQFDQIGGMQYELYEGEFRHIDYIRKDIVKNLVPKTAEELLKQTRTGRKLDLLARKLASYFTIQYLKTEDEGGGLHLPGHMESEESHAARDIYGVSLSARLFNDVDSNPLEYALELNSFYLSTALNVQYEPADSRLEMSLRDIRLEEFLGCRAAIEFVSKPSEVYGLIKISFDF